MNVRRLYGPTVLGLVVTGGAAFALSRQPWITSTLGDGQGAGAVIETSGSDISPLVPGLAIVVIASGLGVLASSGWLRRAIGILIVVAAVGGALAARTDPDAVVDAAVAESVAFGQGVAVSSTTHPAGVTTALVLVLAALLGLMVVVFAPSWPRMSSRYDAPSAKLDPTEADLWKAMDAGLDPTDPEATGGDNAGPSDR